MTMIYHYCDTQAFNGICKTKSIWLTDITKLNDESEYGSGFQIIRELVLEDFRGISSAILERSEDKLNQLFRVLVGCFSKNGDLLSQWRAYGEGGAGYVIGFDQDEIRLHNLGNRYLEAMAPVLSTVNFVNVSYDSVKLRSQARLTIERFERSQSPIKYQLLAKALMDLAIRYKDPFFIEEDEVRAFVVEESGSIDLEYKKNRRDGSNGVCEYHVLNTSLNERHAIRKVMLGPKNKRSIDEVRRFLESEGLFGVEISNSKGQGKYR